MSRSNNTELVNPAVRFFDWSGDKGAVQYFDKTEKKNVEVTLPFQFLILDKVSQVTGGVDRNGRYEGFWSNAVRNLKTQAFTVRSKQGVEATGLWEQLKGRTGFKFMTGLYIAFFDENRQFQIGYLKIKGAALTAWIEFASAYRSIYEGAFSITGANKRTKGSTTYYEPVFKHHANVSEETEAAAKRLDEVLQEYLTAYFSNNAIQDVEREYDDLQDAYTGNSSPRAMSAAVNSVGATQAATAGLEPPDWPEREYTDAEAPPPNDDDDIPF